MAGPYVAEYKDEVNEPDLSPPTDASRPVRSHRGPPVDQRPRSTLGLWALFFSVALALVSTMVGFVWVLILPAALLGLYGVIRIRPDRMRGQGLAIGALIVALLAGSCTYMFAGVFRDLSAYYGRGVLAALAGNEERRLDDWLLDKARDDGTADAIRARYQATVDVLGPYQQEIVQASALVGGRGVIYAPAPDKVDELGGNGELPPRSLEDNAVWARARFERGVVLVELTFGASREGFEAAAQGLQSRMALGVLSDVRFWRETAPAE